MTPTGTCPRSNAKLLKDEGLFMARMTTSESTTGSTRKSKSGMACIEKALSSEDVCRIIEASAKHGVRLLKLADLHIELGPTAPSPYAPLLETPTPAAAVAEPDHERISKEGLAAEELQTREDQIAELILTDPLAAEEMIRLGELEDE